MTAKAVYYKDFGAVGDGVTDDFKAIMAAHDHANKNKLPVFAESGKRYYIGNNGDSFITIKTDTDWTGAEIIIDDSNVSPDDDARKTCVFKIASDYPLMTYADLSDLVKTINEAGGLKTTSTKIPYAPGYPAMVVPYNADRKVYIRYGANQNAGNPQHEVIIVDKDGNIDKDTPILLDYDHVTSVNIYRIDDEPIKVEGGTVITIANQAPCAYTYYSRNIVISRSNVVMKGIKHKIIGEGDHGAPYAGFFTASGMNNLLVEDCTFQAHRYYMNTSGIGGPTNMGTYEIGGGVANAIYYKNCKQSNFMTFDGSKVNLNIWYDIETGETGRKNDDPEVLAGIWGVQGTNYCKNITYDGCQLNRLDAHAGVYNVNVINGCEIMMINLIGGGTALIKDTTVYNNYVASLRGDYGSTWNGEVILDNVTLNMSNPASCPIILHASWANWSFGYETYLPSVTLKSFKLGGTESKRVGVFSEFATESFIADEVFKDAEKYGEKDGRVENRNKQHLPEFVRIYGSPELEFTASSSEASALNGLIRPEHVK